MIEVRRKINDTLVHVGTMVEIEGAVVVAGAARATVAQAGEPNVLLAGFALDAYEDHDAARRDGWLP